MEKKKRCGQCEHFSPAFMSTCIRCNARFDGTEEVVDKAPAAKKESEKGVVALVSAFLIFAVGVAVWGSYFDKGGEASGENQAESTVITRSPVAARQNIQVVYGDAVKSMAFALGLLQFGKVFVDLKGDNASSYDVADVARNVKVAASIVIDDCAKGDLSNSPQYAGAEWESVFFDLRTAANTLMTACDKINAVIDGSPSKAPEARALVDEAIRSSRKSITQARVLYEKMGGRQKDLNDYGILEL